MVDQAPIMEGIFTECPDGMTLAAYKCKACERIHFPKPTLCLDCCADVLEPVPLSRRGRLFTYTIVHMPASHFQPPHAAGYVDLPEGLRIFVPLDIVESKPFQVGMEMEINIGPLWQEEDREIIGYRFSPV